MDCSFSTWTNHFPKSSLRGRKRVLEGYLLRIRRAVLTRYSVNREEFILRQHGTIMQHRGGDLPSCLATLVSVSILYFHLYFAMYRPIDALIQVQFPKLATIQKHRKATQGSGAAIRPPGKRLLHLPASVICHAPLFHTYETSFR